MKKREKELEKQAKDEEISRKKREKEAKVLAQKEAKAQTKTKKNIKGGKSKTYKRR